MTEDTLLWLTGMLVLPAVGFAYMVLSILRDIKCSTDKLLEMHDDPERYGFGSVSLASAVSGLKYAMDANNHYMRWMAENMTGKKPPPFVPE